MSAVVAVPSKHRALAMKLKASIFSG